MQTKRNGNDANLAIISRSLLVCSEIKQQRSAAIDMEEAKPTYDLLDRLGQGDESAFTNLFERYQKRLAFRNFL
jgi:hypothetical protein